MNPNEMNLPATNADRVLNAVRRQQRWLKWLSVLAVVFWALAVLGGVGVIAAYRVFYEPKEKQMFSEYGKYGHLRKHQGVEEKNQGTMTPDEALALHFTMNYVVTKALLVVVVSVIVLSLGTLTTLLLVVLNRRVTLKQINYSLEQISRQLIELKARP